MIRLPANAVLQRRIAHRAQSVGRPPHEVRRSTPASATRPRPGAEPRRVVAKVEWHPGELYPRVGFLVTNLCRPPERVVAFLQSARHGGAVDQRGQECGQLDTSVVPVDEGQRGASSASCAGLQPGQLLPHSGSAG